MPTSARPHRGTKHKFSRQHGGRPSAAKRGYDRKWQRLRQRILKRDKLCQHPGCNELAHHVDHIVPKRDGGKDTPSNLQGLCHHHHSVKTQRETAGETFRSYKTWIVVGPPVSGKTTWIKKTAKPNDLVWDADAVLGSLGVQRHKYGEDLITLVVALREAFAGWLRFNRPERNVFIVVTNPDFAKRLAEYLEAEMKVFAVDQYTCRGWANDDAARNAVDSWFTRWSVADLKILKTDNQ
jgi:hypothetical protein